MIHLMPNGKRIGIPLEVGWGLAAPFAGPSPATLIADFREGIENLENPPDNFYLAGIPRNGRWFKSLCLNFGKRWSLGLGRSCIRSIANLEGGMEAFFSRRSAKTRAGFRQSQRKAQRQGVKYEYHRRPEFGELESLYQRILSVERRAWKGMTKQGIESGMAEEFYRKMIRLITLQGGDLRVLFARLHGEDIAYVFGATFLDVYRGLQMSYSHEHARLSPGNLIQLAIIERLCEEGVRLYDMGTEMPYKLRWAEEQQETVTLALLS